MDRLDSEKLHFFLDLQGERRTSIEEDLMLLVCAKEKTIIFSLFLSARGLQRSIFESSHLREGENRNFLTVPICAREAKRRFTGGQRTPFGGDQIFLFF